MKLTFLEVNLCFEFTVMVRCCCVLSYPVYLCMLRLSSADSATLCGNLEEILTFQQALCSALEDCTK